MIIEVNGNLINTENIFKIGEIKYIKYGYREEDKIGIKFYFTIHLYNQENIIVETSKMIKYVYSQEKFLSQPDFIKAKEEFNDFRESIAKVWGENQRNILKFRI